MLLSLLERVVIIAIGFSTVAVWLIVVIILVILALACAIGVVCGLLAARYLTSLLNGLAESK